MNEVQAFLLGAIILLVVLVYWTQRLFVKGFMRAFPEKVARWRRLAAQRATTIS